MSDEKYRRIFAKNLRRLMEANGKTQLDIYTDLGFDKSAVSTWVNGKSLPRMDKVNKLAEYFHCKRSDLIEDADEEQPEYYFDKDAREAAEFLFNNPEYKVLFDASRKIKKEDIEFVAKMLDKMKGED